MKNYSFLKIAYSFIFVFFIHFFANGQNNFASLSLHGPTYKIVSAEKAPRLAIQIDFGKLFPSQKGIENFNGGGMDSLLSNIYSDRELFEKLYENLGGEFFIGSFSDAPKFENFQQTKGNYIGISGAFRFSPHFETSIHFATYKVEVTAEFPIIVFDEMTFETYSTNGNLMTELKSNTIQLSGNYFPFSGNIQPYAGVGLVYSTTKSSQTKTQMGEVAFNLSENPAANSFGLIFKGGVEVIVYKNIFLNFNGQIFSVSATNNSGTNWNKVLSGGVGVRF
jgi:outer membrane protein W